MTLDDIKLITEALIWLGVISLIFSTIIVIVYETIKGTIKWISNRVAAIRQAR